ncbi:ribosome small subunit-dependent GTPase A [Chloroflexi bacterium TSY]|nr:ribosome small subunit-dependent GTPase A [Chloroflexi bacterium TSY]
MSEQITSTVDTELLSEGTSSAETLSEGLVFRKLQGHYSVQTNGHTVTCSISNKLRKFLQYPTSDPAGGMLRRVQKVHDIRMVDPIAIGDIVRYVDVGDGTGLIKEVAERKNKLARQAAGAKSLEQIVAANVDQIVPIVAAAQPKPKWGMLDRVLAMAEFAQIPVLICLTKIDLDKKRRASQTIEIYEKIGYSVNCSSTMTGEGVEQFKSAIAQKVSVLIGMSGVGKTTLLNAVQPDLGLRVNEISNSTGKGKHTTTHLEMFPLQEGGGVVDTPGMKLFGLWDSNPDDLDALFVEMHPYLGQCHFDRTCTHTHEPDCAIKDAVEAGEISSLRYDGYVKIFKSIRAKGK